MIKQTYCTHCENCGEEVKHLVGDMTGKNEIIVEFIDGMEFNCGECGETTYIQIEKYIN